MLQDLYDYEYRVPIVTDWAGFSPADHERIEQNQEKIRQISQKPKDSLDWFSLIDRYYTIVVPYLYDNLESELSSNWRWLKKDAEDKYCNKKLKVLSIDECGEVREELGEECYIGRNRRRRLKRDDDGPDSSDEYSTKTIRETELLIKCVSPI